MTDLHAAERFLAANARVLERRRFARLFRGGPAWPVRDAVAAYANEDGGFGHALEPDGRGPESQPIPVLSALTILHEDDVWDEALVARACDWLERTAPPQGGATFVLPGGEDWPGSPYWRPREGLPPSLTSTGQIAAPLLARGVEHPWLDRAVTWLWARAEDPGDPDPYDMLGLARFLDATPEQDRAAAAVDALRPCFARALERRPDGPPDEHRALEYAPRPGSVVRRAFEPAQLDEDLDALEAGQQDDGGWTFTWVAWSPVAAAEWRGVVTVAELRTLRLNGRL